jgi:hypothetical protein
MNIDVFYGWQMRTTEGCFARAVPGRVWAGKRRIRALGRSNRAPEGEGIRAVVRAGAPDWGVEYRSDADTETINMHRSAVSPQSHTHLIDIPTLFAGFLS